MLKILFWLLPVVDIFALRKILNYYRTLSVPVPFSHAVAGLVERWVGYLPVGLIMGWLTSLWIALLAIFLVFVTLGPLELYLMLHGVRPWKFFKGKKHATIAKIFLLEGYNAICYYAVGTFLGTLL